MYRLHVHREHGWGLTVTATDGAAQGTATLTVTSVPLDHLALSPASSSITSGAAQTYTVEGFDASNDDLGSLTDATLLISPDGSCTAYTCTATTAGTHTVTATDGTAQGTATLTVITSYAAPCVFSSGGPPDCQSTDPLVTDEATTQGAAGCTLTDNIDWGEGGPVQTVQFTASGPLERFPLPSTHTAPRELTRSLLQLRSVFRGRAKEALAVAIITGSRCFRQAGLTERPALTSVRPEPRRGIEPPPLRLTRPRFPRITQPQPSRRASCRRFGAARERRVTEH